MPKCVPLFRNIIQHKIAYFEMENDNEAHSNSSTDALIFNVFYALGIVEFLIFIPTIPIVILCSTIVYQTSILHQNLKGILLAQLFGILMHIWPRVYALCNQLIVSRNTFVTPPNFFLMSVAVAVLTFNNMAGHVLIVERILSTIYVKTYESNRSWTFTVTWLFFTIILSVALSIYDKLILNFSYNYSKNIVVIYVGAMIASLTEIFVYFVIVKFNQKLFTLRYRDEKNQSLSVRYQLSENIRTGRQLVPNFICHFVTVLIAFILVINFEFDIITNFERITLLYQVLFVVHAFNNIALPIAMLCYHPLLNRKAKKVLGGFNKFVNTSSVSPYDTAQPLDTHGRPFSVRIQQENEDKDAYFKQLALAWD